MLMKRDEGGEFRLPQGELEDRSFGDLTVGLTDVTITRSRAIKLAGAALAGSALTILWPAEADARRRRRNKRRRRAKVSPNPAPIAPNGSTILNITNPSETRDLVVSGAQLLDSAGNVISEVDLPQDVKIAPDTTVPVTFEFTGPLVGAESLRLFERLPDGGERRIDVVANNGTVLGDLDVTLTA